MFKWIKKLFKRKETLQYKISVLKKHLIKIDENFILFRDIELTTIDSNFIEHYNNIVYFSKLEKNKRWQINKITFIKNTLMYWMVNEDNYCVSISEYKVILDHYDALLTWYYRANDDFSNAIEQVNSVKLKPYISFIEEFITKLYDTLPKD